VEVGGVSGFDMKFADAVNGFGPSRLGVDVAPTTGLDVRLGTRSGHFGFELQGEWLPKFEGDVKGTPVIEYNMVSINVLAQLILLTGRVQPFVLLGGGYAYSKLEDVGSTDSEWFAGGSFRVGGGFDVFMTKHVALSTDVAYVIPTGSLKDANFLALSYGLKYVF
jgi:hypothetical protein